MKRVPLVLSAVAIIALVGGASYWAGRSRTSESSPSSVEATTGKEKLPEKFRERLEALMDCATKLSASSKVGMSYDDFGVHLQELQGTFDLAEAVWPSGELEIEKEGFEKLIASCLFANLVWKVKVSGDHLILGEVNDKEAEDTLNKAQAMFPGLKGAIVDGGADGMLAITGSDSNVSTMLSAVSERVEGLQKLILPHL